MSSNEVNDVDVIPSAKIKEAYEICMKDPKLTKYFNDAPAGARQYIALMFYCTVFNDELNDDLCARYQAEVEEELTREDVLYLAENESDPITKMHFRRLYVAMAKAEEAPASEKPAASTGGAQIPVVEVSTANLEQQLVEVLAELQTLRKITAEQALRESGLPGVLTLLCLTLVCCLLGASGVAVIVVPIALAVSIITERLFRKKIRRICGSYQNTRMRTPGRM